MMSTQNSYEGHGEEELTEGDGCKYVDILAPV